jgi:hypothetical protein
MPTNRLLIGGTVLVVGMLSPLLVPLVAASGLSSGWKTTVSGLLVLGIPELFMLVAVAIMGKQGYEYLKSKLFGLFRKQVMPMRVSRARYRVGIVMFSTPLLFGWVTPYLRLLADVDLADLRVVIALDLLLLAAVVVLGGDFWDKIRSLFVHGSSVRFPGSRKSVRPSSAEMTSISTNQARNNSRISS